jgi:hypothetical protein
MTEKTIIAYRLVPVYAAEPDTVSTACLMQCAATGDILDSCGGGIEVISPDVRDMLVSGDLREVFRD